MLRLSLANVLASSGGLGCSVRKVIIYGFSKVLPLRPSQNKPRLPTSAKLKSNNIQASFLLMGRIYIVIRGIYNQDSSLVRVSVIGSFAGPDE